MVFIHFIFSRDTKVGVMTTAMKHYIYISDTKVDMLYSQIDQSLLKKIAVELSIDLKPLGAGLGATIKPVQTEKTRYSKLRLVVEYVEKHLKVGWIDAPETYFKGSLPMGWGLLHSFARLNKLQNDQQEPPNAVYFGGFTDRTTFGMIGSAHHIIGVRSDAAKSGIALYYTPNEMLKALVKETEPPPSDWTMILSEANREVRGQLMMPTEPLEFLAKTYAYKTGDKNTLLGSPIYVAFAN